MSYGLILVPLIAAVAGWLAVGVAAKLLFHPVTPVKFAGVTIQGVLPAKQEELAQKLGEMVSKELIVLSEQIEEKITDPANFRKIMPYVEEHIDQFLRVRLVEKMPMIGMLIGEKTILEMKTIFAGEVETLFPVIMKNYMTSLQTGTELEATVTRKFREVSVPALETSFYRVLSKELRYLRIMGGISGLIIGLIQVFILQLV